MLTKWLQKQELAIKYEVILGLNFKKRFFLNKKSPLRISQQAFI